VSAARRPTYAHFVRALDLNDLPLVIEPWGDEVRIENDEQRLLIEFWGKCSEPPEIGHLAATVSVLAPSGCEQVTVTDEAGNRLVG
jgi:hypothetical protein